MNRIVITGAGIVTPLADTPAQLHAALCDGASPLAPIPAFAQRGLPCEFGGVVDADRLTAELGARSAAGIDKIGLLATVAARRALAASALDRDAASNIGLVLGTMFSSAHTIGEFDRRAQSLGPELASPLDFANTVLNAAAGQTAIRLSLRGPNSTLAGGQAAGLQAIAYGVDLVRAKRASSVLAGGAEEVGIESYVGFCRAGLLCGTNGRRGHVPVPFDTRRTGFAIAEGAAFVVLERDEARGARPALAEVAGFGVVTDPDAMERGCSGREAIAAAIRQALARAQVQPADIDAISAAADGSYAADEEEAAALADVFGAREVPPLVTAIKSALGEALGAAGPLQVVEMIEAMRDGRVAGVRGLVEAGGGATARWVSSATRQTRIATALVTAVSIDGCCCALVLRACGAAS